MNCNQQLEEHSQVDNRTIYKGEPGMFLSATEDYKDFLMASKLYDLLNIHEFYFIGKRIYHVHIQDHELGPKFTANEQQFEHHCESGWCMEKIFRDQK